MMRLCHLLADDPHPDLIGSGHARSGHRRVAEDSHAIGRMGGVAEHTGWVEFGLTGSRLESRIEDFGAEDHGTGGYSAYQETGDHPSILTEILGQALLAF